MELHTNFRSSANEFVCFMTVRAVIDSKCQRGERASERSKRLLLRACHPNLTSCALLCARRASSLAPGS